MGETDIVFTKQLDLRIPVQFDGVMLWVLYFTEKAYQKITIHQYWKQVSNMFTIQKEVKAKTLFP